MRGRTRIGTALTFAALVAGCESTGSTDPKLAFAHVSLEKKAVTMGVDDQYQLSIASNPDGSPITWQSLNSDVAVVSTSGVVTGRGLGTAKVIAAAKRSSDTAVVSVHAPLNTVVLKPDSLEIGWGKSSSFLYSGIDKTGQSVSDFSATTMKWKSSAPSIVSVSGDGTVRGLATGSAYITLTINGKSDSSFVTVDPAPIATVSLTPSPSANVGAGRSLQLGDAVVDSSGVQQNPSLNWSSSDTSVATVSQSGVVTGKKTGSAKISGTVSGVMGVTTIQVVPAVVASVIVALNSSNLQAGQTTQAMASAKDSVGNTLTGRQVVWTTKNSAVAIVTSLGVVSAVAAGTTDVVGTVDGVSASATLTVTPATVGSVGVVLASSSIVAGATTQATATAADPLGNPITGRPVSWSTSNSQIATVSTLGLVTSIAGGTVSVTATVDGVVGSATLVVTKPTVASVSVTPSTASLSVGQTVQASATIIDASGTTLTGVAPTWTSSAPSVASVAANGLITAIGAGTASITASSGGKSAAAAITVQGTGTTGSPSGSPPGGTHIALGILRFDGGSGNVLVSNGIPLPKGLVSPTALSNVRLFMGGVEQSIYIEALSGRYPDGSLRSILVQFNANLSLPQIGELVVGDPRVAPTLPRPTADRSQPTAAALPTDVTYLISTGIGGPTISAAANAARGGSFAKYESDFVQWADYHWNFDGPRWGDNYYDRAAIFYAAWARTGNPEYWRRGNAYAFNYRHDYVEPANYAVSDYWYMGEGLVRHYLATGDSSSFFAVGRIAQQYPICVHTPAENPNCYLAPLTGWEDVRGDARVLQILFNAWVLQSPGDPAYGTFDWGALLQRATDLVLSNQQPNGGYSAQIFCYGAAPYQVGLLNDQLIRQYLYFNADSRIPTSVINSTKWLWTQWIPASAAFHYNSVDCSSNYQGVAVGGLEPAADLTGMLVHSFAWAAKQSNDPTLISAARTVFDGAVSGAYLIGSKQFNQEYTSSTMGLGLFTP
jgi:uncharacterized protein YjdB